MDEWDVQEEQQAPDEVQVWVAEEPAVPEMVRVMRWIGFGREGGISDWWADL
jgi:hypothetical protein